LWLGRRHGRRAPQTQRALARAVEVSCELERLFPLANAAGRTAAEDRLTELQSLLGALPPDTDPVLLCFLRNWTAGCRELQLAGEALAGRYQMRQVRLALLRLQREAQDPASCAGPEYSTPVGGGLGLSASGANRRSPRAPGV
jgi:hypothetical protein